MDTTRNFKEAFQELLSAIPAGKAGNEMITKYGLHKAAFIAYLRKFGVNLTEQHLEKRIQSSVLTDGIEFTGAATVELFTGTFSALYSNMKNGTYTLPEGEHKIIFGLKIENGTNGGAAIPPSSWDNGVQTGVGLDALQNSTLSVKNNGTQVVTDIPLTESYGETLTDRDQGYIPFLQPIIWKGQTDLSTQIKFKQIAAAPNATIRISYIGIGLIS